MYFSNFRNFHFCFQHTGKPKGVVITHRSIVAGCASGDIELGIKKCEDVYLGYLPLAHIMELMAEFVMISQGVTICYSDPKSLSATGASPTGALEHFAPTLMVAVYVSFSMNSIIPWALYLSYF